MRNFNNNTSKLSACFLCAAEFDVEAAKVEWARAMEKQEKKREREKKKENVKIKVIEKRRTVERTRRATLDELAKRIKVEKENSTRHAENRAEKINERKTNVRLRVVGELSWVLAV